MCMWKLKVKIDNESEIRIKSDVKIIKVEERRGNTGVH